MYIFHHHGFMYINNKYHLEALKKEWVTRQMRYASLKKCPTNPEESEALFTKYKYLHPSSLTQMLFIWTNFAVPSSFLLELQISFFATCDVTDTWNTPKQWSLGFC